MKNIRPLRTDADYEWALKEIELYFRNTPAAGSEDADRFDVLSVLLQKYEDENFEIPEADPVVEVAHSAPTNEESAVKMVVGRAMQLTPVQDQAIAARMALIVGDAKFDRLFAGVRFDEVDGDILYVFAKDEEAAAEMEETFALHISIIATDILKREIGIVQVVPRELAR